LEPITFVTEPLLSPDFVQFEVVVPLLEKLRKKTEIFVASPVLSAGVMDSLRERGITPLDGGALFPPIRHSRDEIPPYVWSWLRDAILGWNRRTLNRLLADSPGLRVNFSMTSAFDADAWYIQSGPLGPALEAMGRGVDRGLKWALAMAQRTVSSLDWMHLTRIAARSKRCYSSTRHVADWFNARGIPVGGVFPVYYRPIFRPSTQRPSRDYALAYLGKETDTEALRQLIQSGIPLKLFGSKSAGWVKQALQDPPPNVTILGRLTDEELREVYSNARVTVFPFTEEPFGLIPLESMACGTPVLTYDRQGPGESVLSGRTGWLVNTPEEMVARAKAIFSGDLEKAMVTNCLRRAQEYHIDFVASRWWDVLEAVADGAADPSTVSLFARPPLPFPSPVPSLGAIQPRPLWVDPLPAAIAISQTKRVPRPQFRIRLPRLDSSSTSRSGAYIGRIGELPSGRESDTTGPFLVRRGESVSDMLSDLSVTSDQTGEELAPVIEVPSAGR
jgi:glycosyl transferase family 1